MSQIMDVYAGLLADIVLVAHVSVAAFIVFGLALIVVGCFRQSNWATNIHFSAVHAGLVLFVAVQTALGQDCTLTRLEQKFRPLADQSTYSQSFIQHWLGSLIFVESPAWLFVVLHVSVAAMILAALFVLPPTFATKNIVLSRDADVVER